MVHALTEAHRLLKPNGILIDLRPSHKHRRAGLGEGTEWKYVATMREDLTDDYAANRAIKQIVRNRLFQHDPLIEFDLDRVMDTLSDFRIWLKEFNVNLLPTHEWLYNKIERALQKKPAGTRITVRGLMRLGVLRKIDAS